jgi:hypothetical protein
MADFQQSMKESHFIASIDCRFPYQDRILSLALTEEACSISPNAAFAVVDEILRPPVGISTSFALTTELLLLIEQRLSHPLVQPILVIARKLASGQVISVTDSLSAMRQVEHFPKQYSALSVVYFACDDIEGVADLEFRRIQTMWGTL